MITSIEECSTPLPAWQLTWIANIALCSLGEPTYPSFPDTPAMNEYDTERVGQPIHARYHATSSSSSTSSDTPTATTSSAFSSSPCDLSPEVCADSLDISRINHPKCGACRRLKNKIICDGGFPCGNCKKRGRNEQECKSDQTFKRQKAGKEEIKSGGWEASKKVMKGKKERKRKRAMLKSL